MSEMNQGLPVDIRVASPCAAKWEEMSGSDTVRSCERCRHKVYNLSEMSAPDAADLIRKAEGRLCVRFYHRADGTILTRDCPVGAIAVRRRVARGIGVAFASLLVWSGVGLASKSRSEYPKLLRLLLDRVDPEPALVDSGLRTTPLPMAPQGSPTVNPTTLAYRRTTGIRGPMPTHHVLTGARSPMRAAPVAPPQPAPVSPELRGPRHPVVMGKPTAPAPPSNGPGPNQSKLFLDGVTPDNPPREDPFARQAPDARKTPK